jgi:hypothetical protein
VSTELRLVESTNGPSYGTDKPAGWLVLVDQSGVELWRCWITPTPIEVWAALGEAAGRTRPAADRRAALAEAKETP